LGGFLPVIADGLERGSPFEVDSVGQVVLAEEVLEILGPTTLDSQADGYAVTGQANGLDEAVSLGWHGFRPLRFC
jgi:hypothetical protein